MFDITIKNMLKDKMVTLSLIIGFLLSTAIVSSVPIYTRGIMNRILKSTFDESKIDTSGKGGYTYPASLSAEYSVDTDTSYRQFVSRNNEKKQYIDDIIKYVKAPLLAYKTTCIMDNVHFSYTNAKGSVKNVYDEIVSVSDIDKHIKIIKGTKPSESIDSDKTVDVLVDEDTFQNYCMEIGKIYETDDQHDTKAIRLKIAGVYKIDTKDSYWVDKDTYFYSRLLVTQNEFLNILKADEYYMHNVKKVSYKVIYDYKKLEYNSIDDIYSKLKSKVSIANNRKAVTISCPMISYLETFIENKTKCITLIWIFTIPILVIILLYVYMISGFVVDADKEQIAVLKSRGASLFEILRIYLYEGIIICAIGILIGPVIGLLICKALGYITGFLSFDLGMKPIQFVMDGKAYLYSIAAAFVMMFTLMTSVYFASKNTIVQLKHSKTKYIKSIINVKNLDIIFLLISFYGYYLYSNNKTTSIFGKTSGGVPIDPLLYLVSTIFIIGSGMLILRIYKYVIKLLQIISRRFKTNSFYLAMINVSRYHMNKSIIMLFIIVTVSIGIFDIVVSKNINTSSENTIRYLTGADMTITENWKATEDNTYFFKGGNAEGPKLYIYTEPPYTGFSNVKGISGYTRVINTIKGQVSIGGNPSVECSILGIIPHEFGKIAWFDSSLLKYHWYYYLNAMTTHPNYILISSGLSKRAGIKRGDTIFFNIESGLYMSSVVMDIIDYFPGCNDMKYNSQIIGNFNYIFSKIAKYPYEIWIKKDGRTKDKTIYDSINDLKLNIKSYKDMEYEIYNSKNDVFLKGTNAVLSLGLLSVSIVTIIGFMIYWIKSLKNRKLIFGIYRSLGICTKKITLIIVIEQIFTLVAAIAFGIVVGNITCNLFMPFIEEMWHSGNFTVPVNNLSYMSEYLSFGSVTAVIFILLFLILIKYIQKLKINEAIKMGEE